MSLSQKIAAEVADLVRTCASPLAITAEEGPHRIVVPVGIATPVGIDCQGFDFAVTDRATLPLDDLKAWGQRLASRVTYLMEPLAVLEVDLPLGKALLRSAAPTLRDGKSHYYELLLTRGDRTSASLRRFVGDRAGGEQREAVPFVLTHDAIVKLVCDIVGTN